MVMYVLRASEGESDFGTFSTLSIQSRLKTIGGKQTNGN